MEGRRRRAQRLTQNIQEQAAGEEERLNAGPEQTLKAAFEPAETAEAETSAASGERRRRRAAQETCGPQEAAVSEAHEKSIPQLPQTLEEARAEEKAEKKPGGERVRHAAGASAKAGKNAIKGIGGLILLAMMQAGQGMKKLCEGAGSLARAAKDARKKHAADKPAPVKEDYELEMIRPQDYHGRGAAHAQKSAAKPAPDGLQKMIAMGRKAIGSLTGKGQDRALLVNRVLSVLLLGVALYSAGQIGAIAVRSLRTNRLNESLSQQRAAIIEAQKSDEDGTEQDELAGETGWEAGLQPDEENETEAADEPAIEAMARPEQEENTQELQSAGSQAAEAPDIVKSTKYRKVGGDALPEMAELYEKNRDLVAWVQIPDVLDLPVVYRDNSYYLTRDFNKQKNASGTIFLDENHPFKEKTQNLLLHGHNMKDGTMFGRLAQYLYDDSYIRNHPFIYFDTLWHKEQYVIVAVLNVSLDLSDPRFFNYFTHDTFSSDQEFERYIRQLQLRSYYAIPIDVNPSDALLTLSTCLDDDRLVIVARRLRENETRSELRTLIRMTTRQ